MVEKYIEKMIGNINDEYYEGQRKQEIKESILNALIIATTGVGIICMFGSNIGVGLGLITVSMGITGYRIKTSLHFENKLKRLEQEKRHLRNNGNKEDIDDKDAKRNEKIRKLSLVDSILKRRYENAKDLTWFADGLIIFGAISTAFNPANVWLPLVSIGLGVAATINEVKKYKKVEIINNRINNLKYDFNINQALIEEKELEERRQESIISDEKTAFFDNCINSVNELEENHQEKTKTYYKSKDGK